MPLRTILLRLMLWSLGLAAATGILAVLFQSGDLVWRLVGTGFATALACGLMIPVSTMVDRADLRWAGLLGMGTILAEYFMALVLIWDVATLLLPATRDPELRITLSMVFAGLGVAAAMSCAAPLRTPRHRWAAGSGLGFSAVVLAAYLAAIWVNDFLHSSGDDWWESATVLLVLGVVTVPSLLDLSPATRRLWRWLGMLSGAAGCAMWMTEIWYPAGSPLGVVVFCGLMCVAAVGAHANLCLGTVSLTTGQQWVRSSTIAGFAAAGLSVFLFVAHENFPGSVVLSGDTLERLMAASGIAAGCGTLALFVLARINRHVDAEPGGEVPAEMTVVCPRCRKKQSLAVGGSSCSACGLRIFIRLEEPRCAHCDYLLHGLTSDRCPECGNPICKPSLELA